MNYTVLITYLSTGLIAKPYVIDGQSIEISASIGATIYPSDDGDIDTLIRHADQAMYHAKLAGKNRYHLFNAKQDQQISQKHQQLDEMQHALSNDEFCLHYQPKVNMKTGVMYGAEALIRWQHPEKGLIPPLMFLPVIEGTELEIKIGEWVIKQALEQLGRWNKQGITLEISINIASHHLQSASFIKQLEKAISNQPTVNPGQLQLEILESSALGDIDAITGIIKTCQGGLGVKVALDDFGTGYSSLTHLRNLPAQTIKIDQTFVRDMLDDPDDCSIIDGIIGLAESFDRQVIAEGVETTEHGLMLLLMGCDNAQGYGIARPMPANGIPDWISHYTPNEEWINCDSNKLGRKEIRIQLLKLTIAQCLNRFETAIQSPAGKEQNWPGMERTKCPCCHLIKREKRDGLFEPARMTEFEQAHNNMHSRADSLKSLYHEKGIDAVANELPLFRNELEQMFAILKSG